MKYFFIILLLASVSVQNADARGRGSLADSLMYLHSVANNPDFNGLVGPMLDSGRYGRRYSAPAILGCSGACAYQLYTHSLKLELVYLHGNDEAGAAKKTVVRLFSDLVKTGNYRVRMLAADRQVLVQGGRDIMEYNYSDRADETPLKIDIYQTPTVLADETPYAGKFPELPSPKADPQIVVYKRKGCKDAVERDNGIFANGVLISGSKTISGCNDFLNGTWYSDDWRTTGKDWAFAYVWVAPTTNTADTIFGRFAFSSMEQFSPDKQYAVSYEHAYYRGVFQARKDAPEFIKANYVQQEHKRDEDAKLAEQQYNSAHANDTYTPHTYQKSEAQMQYEERQNRWNARWTMPKDWKPAVNEDQKRRDALHQESVDYYNKIHPYGEGTNDRNGNPIR